LSGFGAEEVGSSFRLLLASLQVLAQIQRGKFVRHRGGELRRAAHETHRKCNRRLGCAPLARIHHIGADHREFDVIAHIVDDHFARFSATRLGIQIVLPDDVEQIRGGHHALTDHLHALVGITGDGRVHEVLGNLLLLDQNGAGGAIGGRPEKRGQAE
jgi:hypothetical protein